MKQVYVRVDNSQEMLDFVDWFTKNQNSELNSFGYPVANISGEEDALECGMDVEPTNELPAIFKIDRSGKKWEVAHKSKNEFDVDSDEFGSWLRESVSLKELLNG